MNKTAKILVDTDTRSVSLVASNGRPLMSARGYTSRFNTRRAKGDIINAMVSALRKEGFTVFTPTTPQANTKPRTTR